MPKLVDHAQRRRDIIEALWRVAAAHGLEAVTTRRVAAEAGISIGRVQHYFASKDELIALAIRQLHDKVSHRVTEGVTGAVDDPRARLRGMLTALLPGDANARTDTRVGMAVFIRALADPALARVYRQGRHQLHDTVAQLVTAVDGAADADTEARILLSMVDGLASDLLLDQCSVAQAHAVIDHQFERLG